MDLFDKEMIFTPKSYINYPDKLLLKLIIMKV